MFKKQTTILLFSLHLFKKYSYLLVILFLILSPLSVSAISSSSYTIDPSGTDAIRHTSTSTTYQLEGSIEPITSSGTSTTYKLESGSSFKGYCGDGFIDPTEDCEGSNLNSQTCATVMGSGYTGTLSCSSACAFVTTACTSGGGGGGGGGGGNAPSTPTFNSSITTKNFTYLSEMLFFGTKTTTATSVYVNNSTSGVTYPTTTKWQKTVSLSLGTNTTTIKARNSYGYSDEKSHTLTRRMIGDVNNDSSVNDYDFSLLANNWGKNYPAADFNGDGIVDDYDLSLLVAYWTS